MTEADPDSFWMLLRLQLNMPPRHPRCWCRCLPCKESQSLTYKANSVDGHELLCCTLAVPESTNSALSALFSSCFNYGTNSNFFSRITDRLVKLSSCYRMPQYRTCLEMGRGKMCDFLLLESMAYLKNAKLWYRRVCGSSQD